jgi:hypothetical protein
MEAIVAVNVRSYIESGILERAGALRENYRRLVALRDRWAEARPRFEERGTRHRRRRANA